MGWQGQWRLRDGLGKPHAMGQARVIGIQSDFFPHKTLTLHSLSGTEGVKSALCLQESSPVYMQQVWGTGTYEARMQDNA